MSWCSLICHTRFAPSLHVFPCQVLLTLHVAHPSGNEAGTRLEHLQHVSIHSSDFQAAVPAACCRAWPVWRTTTPPPVKDEQLFTSFTEEGDLLDLKTAILTTAIE